MMIGHALQTKFLRQSLENERLSHAYLFIGPQGLGKKALAKELIGWILKSPLTDNDWRIKEIVRINDPKTGKKHKDISLDQVRAIEDYLNYHSLISDYQIVLIDEADYLSRGAGNALLKTLEEPRGKKVLIILLAENATNLLPTIVSRCQILNFYPVPTKEIKEALISAGVSLKSAEKIAKLSNHLPGVALNLLHSSEEQEFYKKETERFFKLLKGSLAERWESLSDLFLSKVDHIEARARLVKILNLWQLLWRDIYLLQAGLKEWLNQDEEARLQAQAQKNTAEKIVKVLEEMEKAKEMLEKNIHPRLIMENLILFFY